LDIRNQPVKIFTVKTIDFFNNIQIFKPPTINYYVLISFNVWYAVNFKTNELIQ
jgi:hypothetical protein